MFCVLSRTSSHVDPIIYVDSELAYVAEADARSTLIADSSTPCCGDRSAQRLLHEDIIAMLDEAGDTFHVLLLETDMTLPYTSIFIETYAGYWER
jgi:hypothetical protein